MMPSQLGTTVDKQAIRARYLKVETANVSDVLDELGILDQGLSADFRPFPNGDQKIAGWAYTIRGQLSPYAGSGDPDKMRALEGVSEGDITVWSGGGAEGICFFGELIALGMQVRGCAGALVDGGIRDVQWLHKHGFPVYARYRTPVQSIGRWKVNASDLPVYLPGATSARVSVAPGDFILGDVDGVIVVPNQMVLPVLEKVEKLTEMETKIRAELDAGASLAAVLEKYGHV